MTTIQPGLKHRIFSRPTTLDENLPVWARRSNPIIRRQLGIYWRVFIPQVDFIARWYAYQAALLLLTIQFDFLFAPILMMVLASALLLPIAFWMYAQILQQVIVDSVAAITEEFRNDTLTLLRATPFSVPHIVLSKVAGAFWRQMEALDGVLSMALFLGTPIILFIQVLVYPPDQHPGLSQVLTIVLVAVALVRLPLEIFMVGAIGIASGTAGRTRSTGIIITTALTFFYFLLLNLPRLLVLPLPLYVVVEVVLPLALPLLITLGCIQFTLRVLLRD